jgi:uncharacterized protein YdbL (DUF1318 family)
MTRSSAALATAALLLAGCVGVTINVTFPQEKIDSAASGIEDLVRTPPPEDAAPAPPKTVPRKDSRLEGRRIRWAALFGPAPAEAQAVPELKTRTPEVMAVIESRRARWGALSAALGQGCVGESNRGLVEPRPGPGCPTDIPALTEAENRDRMVLYRTLVEQNSMPAGDIARVQASFARANRERVPPGAWVQDEGGRWSRK